MGCWLPEVNRELTSLGSQIAQNKLQYQGPNDTKKFNTNMHSYLTEKKIKQIIQAMLVGKYSQLSPRRTPLGPALSVRLREMSVLQRVKQREERKAGTNSRCPFYRGVRLIEVSVKRQSTVERRKHKTEQKKLATIHKKMQTMKTANYSLRPLTYGMS